MNHVESRQRVYGILFIIFVLLILTPTYAKKKKIENLTAEERSKLANLKVFENNPLPDGSYKIIATVTGTSCMRNAYGRDASASEAASAMKMEAASLGADLLINVVIQERGVDWKKNCWHTIVAVGDAVRITNPEMLRPKPATPPPPPNTNTPDTASIISSGTGWVVSPCLIVTNHHVVDGHTVFTAVLQSGQKLSLKLIQKDKANDLALLALTNTGTLPDALPLATESARLGAKVFTIGFPHPDVMGSAAKLTDGIVNATTGIGDDVRFYQVSVPIQAGNSGGPVINMNGEVIGVATSKLNAAAMLVVTGDLTENVGYALKVDYLRPLIGTTIQTSGNCKTIPAQTGTLETLADRIRPSILQVTAE